MLVQTETLPITFSICQCLCIKIQSSSSRRRIFQILDKDLSTILSFCCTDKAASIFSLGIALKGSPIMDNKSVMSMEHVQQQLSFVQERRVARLNFI